MRLGRYILSVSLLALACGSRTESFEIRPDEGIPLSGAASCPRGADVTAAESKARACGGECQIKACSTGRCSAELVTEDADSPLALAVGDGGQIYWSTGLGGAIRHFSPGGAIAELAKVGGWVCHQHWPGPLIADQKWVYWSNRALYETDGRIMVQGLSESFPRVLLARDELENRSLAGSDTHLYWVEFGTRIMRLQK